jgi:hypothetical protein
LKGAEVVTRARRPSVQMGSYGSRNEIRPMGGDLLVVALSSLAFKFCNPAGMLPKFDVVTVNDSLGAFLGSVVIIANEIDDLNDVAISAHQGSSIVRHRWTILQTGAPNSPSSQSRTLDSIGSLEIIIV